MQASLVFLGLCTLALIWCVAESDAQKAEQMKQMQKAMQCLQGSDINAKMERIKKAGMACKDKLQDHQGLMQCVKKEMGITPEEEIFYNE